MGPFDWLIPFWGQHQKLDSEWIDWMIIDLNSKIKYIVFPWRWYSTAFIASIPPHWDKNWGQSGREICHRLLKRFILDLVFLSVLLNKWVCNMGALRYTCYFNHFFYVLLLWVQMLLLVMKFYMNSTIFLDGYFMNKIFIFYLTDFVLLFWRRLWKTAKRKGRWKYGQLKSSVFVVKDSLVEVDKYRYVELWFL